LVRPGGARFAATLQVRSGAGKRLLGRIDGVGDRDGAASWMNARIRVRRDALPTLDDDEYYLWQLVGARVIEGDEQRGRVVEVHANGPVEVFEIRGPNGEVYWVPSLHEHVAELDVANGLLVLHPGSLVEAE
jgi:16S rRNA processing protein RimM